MSSCTAYRRASLIDLYVHAKFYWNQRNFLWTDGRTCGRTKLIHGRTFQTGFIRSTLSKSRPKNDTKTRTDVQALYSSMQLFSRCSRVTTCRWCTDTGNIHVWTSSSHDVQKRRCLQFCVSMYNNRIVKMSRHALGLRGRTDGRATVGRSRHGRQAASVDRLRAGIEGSAGDGQAKIAMSRQRRGLRGRTDGRAGGYR